MPPLPSVGQVGRVGCPPPHGGGADAFLDACKAIADLLHVYRPPDSVGAVSPSDDTMEDVYGSGASGTAGSTMTSGSIIESGLTAPSLARALVRDAGASPDGVPPPPSDGLSTALDGPTEGTWVFILMGVVDSGGIRTAVSFDNVNPTDTNRRVSLFTSGANVSALFPGAVNLGTMTHADFLAHGALLAVTRDATASELQADLVEIGGTVSLNLRSQATSDWDGCVIMGANDNLSAVNFDEYGVVAAVAYDRVLSNAELQTIMDAVA